MTRKQGLAGKKKDGGPKGAPSRGGFLEFDQAAFLAVFEVSATVVSNHFVISA